MNNFKQRLISNALKTKGGKCYFIGGTMHDKIEDNLSLLFSPYPPGQRGSYTARAADKLLRFSHDWSFVFIIFYDNGTFDTSGVNYKIRASEMEGIATSFRDNDFQNAVAKYEASMDENGTTSERKPISCGWIASPVKELNEATVVNVLLNKFKACNYLNIEQCNIKNKDYVKPDKNNYL